MKGLTNVEKFTRELRQVSSNIGDFLSDVIKSQNKVPYQSIEKNISEHFVNPFLKQTLINEGLVFKIIKHAAFDSLFAQDVKIQSRLLDPQYIDSNLFRPLRLIGIKHPHKFLYNYPELIDFSLQNSNDETRVTKSLKFLREQLSKKDLRSLINNCPIVLTYNQDYLNKLYNYLALEIRLETGSEIALMRTHQHEMRNKLSIRISTSLAWRIPLYIIQARYNLAKMLNCWPPKEKILENGEIKSSTEIFNQLLSVPQNQLGSLLGLLNPQNLQKSQLRSSDVIALERMFNDKMLEDHKDFHNNVENHTII